jgi:hypothetical protein
MEAIASEVETKLEHLGSSELSNVLWAMAVLKHQPSTQWWSTFERQVYHCVTTFTDGELANL